MKAHPLLYVIPQGQKPKGAVLTQDNMFWNALNNTFAIDLTMHDRYCIITFISYWWNWFICISNFICRRCNHYSKKIRTNHSSFHDRKT